MARIRTIKPEMPQSESLGRVSREARLCFILLWTQADDLGRLRGNSRMLASLLYPYDDDAKGLIDGWLNELESENCIRRYAVDGDHFIDIPKWLEHQKIDHPSASKIPAFDEASREFSKPRENSLRTKDQGPRTKDQESLPLRARELTAVPKDFSSDAQTDQWAALKCIQQLDLQAEAEVFVDHYRANGELRADWQAAFRKWLAQRGRFNGTNGTRSPRQSTAPPSFSRAAMEVLKRAKDESG